MDYKYFESTQNNRPSTKNTLETNTHDDDSDEYNIKFDPEKYSEQIKDLKLHRKVVEYVRRSNMFKSYFISHRKDPDSIFCCRFIKFKCFNCSFIEFVFIPHVLIAKYILPKRRFPIALKYKYKQWIIHQNHAPDRDVIYKLFHDNHYHDEDVLNMIMDIYIALIGTAVEIRKQRKARAELFKQDPSIYLSPDEEQLFCTNEERKIRNFKLIQMHKRMIRPSV